MAKTMEKLIFSLSETYICYGDLLFLYFYFGTTYPEKMIE